MGGTPPARNSVQVRGPGQCWEPAVLTAADLRGCPCLCWPLCGGRGPGQGPLRTEEQEEDSCPSLSSMRWGVAFTNAAGSLSTPLPSPQPVPNGHGCHSLVTGGGSAQSLCPLPFVMLSTYHLASQPTGVERQVPMCTKPDSI